MNDFSEHFGPSKNSYRIAYLISGFLQKNLSIEEEEELDAWILESDSNMQLFEELTDGDVVGGYLNWYDGRRVEARLLRAKQNIKFEKPARSGSFRYAAIAACAAGVIGILFWYVLSNKTPTSSKSVTGTVKDIEPGSEYAILTVGSGKTVTLRSGQDTTLGDNVRVANGLVMYTGEGSDSGGITQLKIPRKGFFQLVMPDGTHVWLNAESSITYSNWKGKKERNVTVTGETYFEVARDTSKPFVVSTRGCKIEALGTAFDVNAYEDEKIFRTTLIHGSIRVSNSINSRILKPGQQIQIADTNWTVKNDLGLEEIVAWKTNEFKFADATIESIMQQVQRWYDVRVAYDEKIYNHFNGTISRNVPLSHLLHLLEETGKVKFKVMENQIFVSN